MVYVWGRRNEYVRMRFLGLFQFRAPFLPWVRRAPRSPRCAFTACDRTSTRVDTAARRHTRGSASRASHAR
eukprot:6564454-Prymnesium_polylepis.2